ncbi:Crotonobetainyl-CoA:carnitine CoA-transferase CaiB-like acyl-CoA transferase OS=Castellaniella defragrans OX=75697 GN=HNR28_000229 PE=4 SV=1 [Castellaniella defragrans]
MEDGTEICRGMLRQMLDSLGGPAVGDVRISGSQSLESRYPVSDLACASIGAAALMLAAWRDPRGCGPVRLDRALASRWFGYSVRTAGWTLPKVRSALTGDYRARDGWIRIHANAPHHEQRALRVLGLTDRADHEVVAGRVRGWDAAALEEALVAASACAAVLRPPGAWRLHPQGLAVAAEPLVACERGAAEAPALARVVDRRRPLSGVRVLDLTRVLAGPVATRFLAAYGATVLRLDPPTWSEPGMVPEVTVGKYCAGLDLKRPEGRARFAELLSEADVLVHGYRPGALQALGFGPQERARLCPGLVDVSLDAWGWTGPWRGRRGFDSLVQMSTGIAYPGSAHAAPDPLPVQALDQSSGYLLAACALRGLGLRRERACGSQWRLSLARTAWLLSQSAAEALGGSGATGTFEASSVPGSSGASSPGMPGAGLAPSTARDFSREIEATHWGPARRLRAPVRVGNLGWKWDRAACDLRSDPPAWP